MKIAVKHTFIHGKDTFSAGEVRIVEDSLGDYFWRAGWVEDLTNSRAKQEVSKSDVILQVEDITKSVSVER